MRKNAFVALAAVLALGACTSTNGATSDGGTTVGFEAGGGGDINVAAYQPTTVAALRAMDPFTGTPGGTYEIKNGTITVSLTYSMGAKWKGYLQDTGVANGLDLYCNSLAKSYTCFSKAPAIGATVDMFGVWDPYMGVNELIPLKVNSTGTGKVTWTSPQPSSMFCDTPDVEPNPTGCVKSAGSFLGAPVALAGGPWTVSSITPMLEKNTAYQPMCAKGPQYFGFEVTAKDGTVIMVTTDWYKSMPLFTDPACAPMTGGKMVTMGMTFSKLGGIVDVSGTSATAPFVVVEPTQMSDYATP